MTKSEKTIPFGRNQTFRRILFKNGRRTICYVEIWPDTCISKAHVSVRTGKPSDASCIGWKYGTDQLDQAMATAEEYFTNFVRPVAS